MMWQQTWWIAKNEVKDHWRSLFITLLVNSFFALLAASQFQVKNPESLGLDIYFVDVVFLILIPNFVTIFLSSNYFRAYQMTDDLFTKQMALYRILPVSLEALTMSRILKMIILYLIQSILFFAVFLFVVFKIHPEISLLSMIYFILFWFGICFALGSIMPVFEAGQSVKVFNLFCFAWVVIFLIIYALFEIYLDYGPILWSWQWIEQGGWTLAVMGPLIGCLVCYFWGRVLYHRLKTRDYV